MKLDILAIGAHPDDVELSCCGTLLKQIDAGNSVGLLDLTKGELGTRGSAKIRTQEAGEAAKLMGAKVRVQLDLADGFFAHTEDNLKQIIKIIRRFQPEIVLANAVDDRHPDHGRAAKLTADACFLSGLVKIETYDNTGADKHKQLLWRPKFVYHYIQDRSLKPDFVIDISAYMERKLALILTYKSQFYNPDSNEPETPISGENFLNGLRSKDAVYGRHIGANYAEGFTSAKYIGVNNLFDLK